MCRRKLSKLSKLSNVLGTAALLLICGLALMAYKGSAEIAVNTTTESDQRSPAAAMDKAGNFLVVWESWGQDGSNYGIIGRRFDAAGLPLSPEFVVNSYVNSNQFNAAVAMKADGSFVVAWTTVLYNGWPSRICVRRFNKDGSPQSIDFIVDQFPGVWKKNPEIGMDGKGNFVIVWESWEQDGSSEGVYARRFNAAGKTLGGEFRVNTTTKYSQKRPSIAVDRAGNFLIIWESGTQDGSGTGIYARRYNSKGQATTPEMKVNKYTKGYQMDPAVAVDPWGNFVAAWESDGQDGSSYGVYARKLNNKGQVAGPEFRVNKYTKSVQDSPAVAVDAAGNFVIAWVSYGQDGSYQGVYFRPFRKSGQVLGAEARANIATRYYQLAPTIAMDGPGNFVVAWQDGVQDGSVDGIFARVFKK